MCPNKRIFQSIINGSVQETADICRELINSGYSPQTILENGLIPTMDKLGSMFAKQKSFVPQILLSAKAMQAGMKVIEPLIIKSDNILINNPVIIGTVKGDIHTIGKDLVSIMLRSVGFRVIDLGTNVSPQEFLEAVLENRSKILSMSAMLTSAMLNMRETTELIQNSVTDWKVNIIIGGAPITKRFAEELGVNYANNAVESMNIALEVYQSGF